MTSRAKTIADYYKDCIESFKIKRERARITVDELIASIKTKRSNLVPDVDKFKYPVIDYPEFQQNTYINGRLENAAKGMYEDEKKNMELKHLCFRLVGYAVDLRKIYEEKQNIKLYDRIINTGYNKYRDIVRQYYNEVQKKLILDGYAYRLTGNTGYICINRVVNTGAAPICDFAATRKNKARLQAEGKRIYNKEEAEFCKKNGIEYDGVNPNVYKSDEAWYQYCLIGNKIANRKWLELKPIDTKGKSIRDYSNEDILNLTHNNLDEIMKLDMSLRHKLSICLQADKTLYTKFIRNEEQKKCLYGTSHWKG